LEAATVVILVDATSLAKELNAKPENNK